MKVFFILIAILISAKSFSTQIEIVAKGYFGKKLEVKKSENFLLSVQPTLTNIEIPETEKMSLNFSVKEPTRVYFSFDIYQAWLVVEPDKKYTIRLPKPTNQIPNTPFFEPLSVHLLPENSDSSSLNFLIEEFQKLYEAELNKNISKLVYGKSKALALQIIDRIEQVFVNIENSYFQKFRNLNYATIELLAQPRSKMPVVRKYLSEKELMYEQVAYANLFKQIFNDYFISSEWASKSDDFNVLINQGNLSELKLNIASATGLSDQFCEAIILLNLDNLFFSRQYNPNGLMKLVSDLAGSSFYLEHRDAASNLNHKFLLHLPGAAAPALNIPDLNGNTYNWGDSYFKYVYLYFANEDTLNLQKNLKYLESISNAFMRELEIIIVVPNETQLIDLINQKGARYTILQADKIGEVYRKFNVQVFPTFYLINPKGKMVWFQTPWPEERFASQFKQVISNK